MKNKKNKKDLRKSKRPGAKNKNQIYSVTKFINETEICFKTEGEARKIFQEEIYKTYKKWIITERIAGRNKSNVIQIMRKVEEWLNIGNTAKINSEKSKLDLNRNEKQLEIANEYYEKAKFLLDIVGMEKGESGESFFIVKSQKELQEEKNNK